jgi:SRSO17 transposase
MELRPEQGAFPGDMTLEAVRTWTLWRTEVERRIGARFARREVRWRAWAYLRGLLSPVERKNGWQVAEVNGEPTPYGVQHLLGRAMWDADALRDDLRPYVVEPLGAPEAVLVVDETGFLKKGQHSAGVARQYSGTAGRVEHCPIGGFLTYASSQGHVLLARDLYLPREWTDDEVRCQGAGMPPERTFATKPHVAQQMLQRAFEAGVPASGVAGERVYGDKRALRRWLEDHHHAHVVAVSGKAYVWCAGRPQQVKTLMTTLGAEGWCRLRVGDGAKGPRWYDWRWLPLATPLQPRWGRWLLVRRSLHDPTELTAYGVFAPQATVLETVVQVAGSRWTVERCFEEAKGEVGRDH